MKLQPRTGTVSRPWVPVTSESIPDSPELSENEFEVFLTDTYQLELSVSYLADMLEDDDTLSSNLWYHQGNNNIASAPMGLARSGAARIWRR